MAMGSHRLASAWIHASRAVTTGQKEKLVNETIKMGKKTNEKRTGGVARLQRQRVHEKMQVDHVSGSTS